MDNTSGSYTFDALGGQADEVARLEMQAEAASAFDKLIWRFAGLEPSMRVLEIGCGPGYVTRTLAKTTTGEVVGVDINRSLLDVAAKTTAGLPNVRLIQQDVYALDLPEAGFDFAYARLVLEHLPDPVRAIEKIASVLKPGGIFCAVDTDLALTAFWPEPPGFSRLVTAIAEAQRRAGGDADCGRKLFGYFRAAGLESVRSQALGMASDQLGMKMFLELAVGFRSRLLAADGATEAEQYVREVRALEGVPNAWGCMSAIVAAGCRPR